MICSKCGQVDIGQTGEYPCPECGLPLMWDDEAAMMVEKLSPQPGDVLIVRIPKEKMTGQIYRSIENLKTPSLVLNENISIELIDEKVMNEAGWYRK